jgi:hypothetical protein
VRFPDNGDIAVWQRWLFRNEEDFAAASGLTAMQSCNEVELQKNAEVKLRTRYA